MFCPHCGKPNKEDGKFCVHCGKTLTQKNGLAVSSKEVQVLKNSVQQSKFVLGYRYTSTEDSNLSSLQSAIEKKGDFVKKSGTKDYTVYQSSKGDKTIVTFSKGSEIFVLGNELGLASAQTRFFKKTKIKPHRIDRTEIPNQEVQKLIESFPHKKTGFLDSQYLDWRIDKKTLENQIESYSNLGWTAARRKQAALLILASLALTSVLAPFNILGVDMPTFIYSLIIYLPLAIFMFRGHRWAFVAGMILWTFEKGYSFYITAQLGNGNIWSFFLIFIWWATYMRIFWQAFKVERVRRKVLQAS